MSRFIVVSHHSYGDGPYGSMDDTQIVGPADAETVLLEVAELMKDVPSLTDFRVFDLVDADNRDVATVKEFIVYSVLSLSRLYVRDFVEVGVTAINRVSRDENTEPGSEAWLIFEVFGIHFKLTGEHFSGRHVKWDSLDSITEVAG